MSITPIEKVLYTAKAHTTGGREGGASRTSDGHLDVKLTPPGTGTGTNPEQLFAVGWSACYLSAIKLLAAKMNIKLPESIAVDPEVDLGKGSDGGYILQMRMNVRLPGIAPDVAQELVDTAHTICPYSKATHGNINVVTTVTTELADQML